MLDSDCFEYRPHFLPERQADRWLQQLWRELEWRQQEITLFGRRVMQPRLVAWYGEPQAVYAYSGLTLRPLPWHPVLLELKERIEEAWAAEDLPTHDDLCPGHHVSSDDDLCPGHHVGSQGLLLLMRCRPATATCGLTRCRSRRPGSRRRREVSDPAARPHR